LSDLVVTVPLSFGLDHWIAEGDPAGEPWSGQEWGFYLGGGRPDIAPGERVYVVHNCKIRGFAPLIRVERTDRGWCLVRGGGAVAVTVPSEHPIGFRGWRKRWWPLSSEVPFPDWRKP
jgi:hypothetical protein